MLLNIDLTRLGVEVCHLLVGHIRALGHTHALHISLSQCGVMETLGSMELTRLVVIDGWSLDACGSKFTHLLMQRLTFTVSGNLDHMVSLSVTTARA